MKRTTSAVCGAARIISSAAIFYWFFYFLTIIAESETAVLLPLWPAIALALVFIAGRMASDRGMVLLYYVLMQIALTAAGCALIWFTIKTDGAAVKLRALGAFAFALAAVVSARAAASEQRPEILSRRFDISVLMCALLIYADYRLKLAAGPYALGLFFVSMLALLIALMSVRSEGNAAVGSGAGRVLPFVLLAVIVLIAAGINAIASGAARNFTGAVLSLVKGFFGIVGAAAAFLWSQWTRFCAWLATLFPDKDAVPVNIDIPDDPTDLPEPAEPSHLSVVVLYVMTALLAVVIVAAFVLISRNIRVKRKTVRRLNNRQAQRSGSMGSGLKKSLKQLAENIKYRIKCITQRNTPAGLLAFCESKVPRALKRVAGESGPEFLRRLSQGREASESEALRALSVLVEKAFYGKGRESVPPELCAAIKRCRF